MKALLYCKKVKPYLYDFRNILGMFDIYDVKQAHFDDLLLNGKIVAECDIEIEEIGLVEIPDYAGDECHTFVYDVSIYFETKTLNQDKLFKKSCLNWEEMEKCLYSTNGKGYAIYIKNLHIFDKPKQLSDFELTNNCCFEKEVGTNWNDEPIYECKNPNACKYKDDCAPVCDKHFYPLKRVNNMTKVFDPEKCEWSFVISCNSEELSAIFDKRKEIIVRKKVLKGML